MPVARIFVIVLSAIVAIGALLAPSAGALQVPLPNNMQAPKSPIQTTSQVTGIFCTALAWIFWGLIVVAIVMTLIGGYRHATSSGEPEKVSEANRTLLYAAIAVAVAVLAAGVPYIVANFVQSQANVKVC